MSLLPYGCKKYYRLKDGSIPAPGNQQLIRVNELLEELGLKEEDHLPVKSLPVFGPRPGGNWMISLWAFSKRMNILLSWSTG